MSLVCSPNSMWAHWSSSLIRPVALRRDTPTLTSWSKKTRVSASVPRLGMEAMLRLRYYSCGIIIPQAYRRPLLPKQSEGWMVIEFGWECSQKRPHLWNGPLGPDNIVRLRFIRVASLRPTVDALATHPAYRRFATLRCYAISPEFVRPVCDRVSLRLREA